MIKNFDIHTILKLLPHRYPFLLVDRITSFTQDEGLVAYKNVTINEEFFQGHFPIRPVMPGVLMLEALAQATGLYEFLNTKTEPEKDGIYYLAGIDKARFKNVVVPGDQLILSVKLIKTRRTISRFACEALVGEKLACSAEIMSIRQDVYTENALNNLKD